MTLKHTFYGRTLKQAIGIAHSHLITDFFYSSSFTGEMTWNGTVLKLYNDGEIISYDKTSNDKIKDIMDYLYKEAYKINKQKYNHEIPQAILDIAENI